MWILILSSAVVLGVIAAASCRLAIHVLAKTVEERHREMDHVFETRRPPAKWLRPATAELGRKAHECAKRACLKRLDALLAYARRTVTVADEESRETLVAELEEVRAEWLAGDWGAFLAEAGEVGRPCL